MSSIVIVFKFPAFSVDCVCCNLLLSRREDEFIKIVLAKAVVDKFDTSNIEEDKNEPDEVFSASVALNKSFQKEIVIVK